MMNKDEKKELKEILNNMDSLNEIVQFMTVNYKTEKKLNVITKPIIISGVIALIETCNLERI